MMDAKRTTRLLDELTLRYKLEDRFLDKVKPIAENILALDMPEGRRTELLEMLAETCQRDLTIREATSAAREAWQSFMEDLSRLAEILYKRRNQD
jgi:hypothetical protein